MLTIPDPVELTQALIGFDTINPPGNERACAEYLAALLSAGGFSVKTSEFDTDRTSLVASFSGAGPDPLCFTGHIDTVPLGAVPWTKSPFDGEIEDGRLFGRGSSDMKSGVACFVIAALSLVRDCENPPSMVLVITAGEETGCEGAAHLASETGTLGRAGAMVVAEPTALYPVVGHKGALWLKAVTHGVTAHGATPELGENAVYKAARAVTLLEDFGFNLAPHDVLGSPSLNVGTVSGGMNFNSVPDQSEIGIDIRTIPGQDNVDVRRDLAGYLGKDVVIEPVVDVQGMASDPENNWIQDVFRIMSDYLGEEPVPRGAPYFTDASILTPAFDRIPTIVLGPGEPKMAHQTDEYCMVDKLAPAVDAYQKIGRHWAGIKDS